MRLRYAISSLLSVMSISSAMAADLQVSVEIPTLEVAEYHKPYVALWLENEKGESTNLAVWYQLESRGEKSEKGEEWLKDMRQWWRRIGRDTDMPVDGVSGATRAPGKHTVTFAEGKAPLGKLKPGNYVLMVDAAREVGGRELVKVPFTWPVTAVQSATGKKELGEVKITP
ncbi:DUF2271 domain-containing protein [Cellvibrio fontiphilus]|uniref:DUF2271 domain-containing protein n=1 Tax=Cellvibrio fontiphilus TaxID=1815559 RepID=A0ABV7FGV8_9GAMM